MDLQWGDNEQCTLYNNRCKDPPQSHPLYSSSYNCQRCLVLNKYNNALPNFEREVPPKGDDDEDEDDDAGDDDEDDAEDVDDAADAGGDVSDGQKSYMPHIWNINTGEIVKRGFNL